MQSPVDDYRGRSLLSSLLKGRDRCIHANDNDVWTIFTLRKTTSQLAVVMGLMVAGPPGLVHAIEGEILDDTDNTIEILNPIDEVSEFLDFGKKLKNNQINRERASAAEKERMRKG